MYEIVLFMLYIFFSHLACVKINNVDLWQKRSEIPAVFIQLTIKLSH